MKLTQFDYHLSPELIAQTPVEPRHNARLLVVHRKTGQIEHRHFYDLPAYLNAGDVLVANNSRVLHARLFATKETGGKLELLLLKQQDDTHWEVLGGGKRLRVGLKFKVNNSEIAGQITEDLGGPRRVVCFNQTINECLPEVGHIPLPPYIQAPLADAERYQTIYSQAKGSSAAPTAGLHFTPEILLQLRKQGVLLDYVTLHVGLDTFKPVVSEDITAHHIHSEWASLSPQTAKQINEAKLAGGKLVAVGTTSVRTLETAALRSAGIQDSLQNISNPEQNALNQCPWRPITAFEDQTDLYIYPGYHYRAVDSVITNFHLPKSSLLMLVGAFMGLDLLHKVYQTAIAEKYRFYSFGDAMLIL